MRARLKDTPHGVARYIYSYLATLLATAISGLVTIIATPIVDALPTCRADQSGDCALTLTIIIGLVAVFAALFLVAHLLRLGWQWAAWLMALTLILIQVIIESNTFAPLWFLLILPALATLITSPAPPSAPTTLFSRLRLAALVIALIQFVVWFVLLLVS